jgi:hypothetical protein
MPSIVFQESKIWIGCMTLAVLQMHYKESLPPKRKKKKVNLDRRKDPFNMLG